MHAEYTVSHYIVYIMQNRIVSALFLLSEASEAARDA